MGLQSLSCCYRRTSHVCTIKQHLTPLLCSSNAHSKETKKGIVFTSHIVFFAVDIFCLSGLNVSTPLEASAFGYFRSRRVAA